MKLRKPTMRTVFLIVLIAALLACACLGLMKIGEERKSRESAAQQESAEPDSAAADERPGVRLTPAAQETPTPTSTPTPTPAYVADISDIEAETVLSEDEIDTEHLEIYFQSYEISDSLFARIYGDDRSFKTYCQVPREDLRYIKLLYRGFDEKTHVGELMVNAAVEADILEIFRILYENDYPISKMVLVDNYNASDAASIADNNTSAFNYRTVTNNPSVVSWHGKGVAIDINPINNPYVWYDEAGNLTWEDPDAGLYLDREAQDAYKRHMINHSDLCYQLFTERGWIWGGDWSGPIDYQHFEKYAVDYGF